MSATPIPTVDEFGEPSSARSMPLPIPLMAVAAVLFLGIYGPTFLWMMQRWNADPSATHGWLVIPIAGAVAYGRRERLRRLPLSSHPAGLTVMGCALFLHLLEKFFDINGPSPLSIPFFLAGAVWYFAGTAWLRELSFPLAYLLFMVPIPGAVNQFVSFPLRLLAHNGSKAIAGLFGVEIAGAGMSMEFWRPGSDHTNPERDLVSLMVADPCSGLHSLMAIKALHAITAYLSRLNLTWKWILFWCALPISLLANVFRMVFIILVSAYADKNFGLHLFHDYSPYLLFLFVFGILFFVGLVMELVTGAYSREDSAHGGLANVG
ncbi:MAG: exosortase/archaeosortase family protein [Capsulimonadales bacterium]|nr:exosortase/archaeosortase family protein [Capsulimonadales bacterium]